MAYAIDWERHGACIRYQDRVTFQEFMQAVLEIHAATDYATTKYVIHDMAQASELDFSGLDLTAMVAQELGARFTNPGVRPAVVSRDPTMEKMTRAFGALTQREVGFFADLAQARAWVGALPTG